MSEEVEPKADKPGMSDRTYIATQAMVGILSGRFGTEMVTKGGRSKLVAELSCQYADALLAELSKK